MNNVLFILYHQRTIKTFPITATRRTKKWNERTKIKTNKQTGKHTHTHAYTIYSLTVCLVGIYVYVCLYVDDYNVYGISEWVAIKLGGHPLSKFLFFFLFFIWFGYVKLLKKVFLSSSSSSSS